MTSTPVADLAVRPASETLRPSIALGQWPLFAVVVLIGVPNVLFLATHLASPILATACIGCTVAALFLVGRDLARTPAQLDPAFLSLCLVVAAGLCLLGGEGHLFFANDDWLIRDAVLHDLVVEEWPVGYRYGGDVTMLRAPLGLYLAPALIGKALGFRAAHGALLVQNSLLFGAIFYVLARTGQSRQRAFRTLAVFCVFSGWDVIGMLFLQVWVNGRSLALGLHLEAWIPSLQFSSHVTQLFWAPNHAASGWAFVAAFVMWRSERLSWPSLVTIFGLCVFWSPLSMIGAVPFVAWALVRDLRGRIRLPDLAPIGLAGLALLPVGLYLIADSGRVPHEAQDIHATFLFRYAIFITLEVAPALAFVMWQRPRATASIGMRECWLAVAILLAVPFYRLGSADFVMRASIPALAILALLLAEATQAARPRSLALAVVVMGLGAMTPFNEIARATGMPAFRMSDCNLVTAARFPPNDGPLFHYLARVDHIPQGAGRALFKTPSTVVSADARANCWPD